MIPMERNRIFKILTEIFPDDGVWRDECVVPYIMKEDASTPHDINFVCPDNTHLNGYHDIDYWLRIIDPRDDCPEYNFVLHSSISNKDANIAIDGAGNYRIYGDEINSIILTTIKNNIQKFCDYAVELTCQEHNQVVDEVIYHVDKFLDIMMNKYANVFDQKTSWVSEYGVTCIKLMCLNHPEKNIEVNIVKHIRTENVMTDDIWIRFHFNDQTCFVPIIVFPWKGNVDIEVASVTSRLAFAGTTEEFSIDTYIALAWKLGKQLGYTVVSTNEYIQNRIAKYQTRDYTKAWLEQYNSDELPDEPSVFKAIERWFDSSNKQYECNESAGVIQICGTSPFTICLKEHYGICCKSIELNGHRIINIELFLKDPAVCVCCHKETEPIEGLMSRYDICCFADFIRTQLGFKHLKGYTSTDGGFHEITHCSGMFLCDNGKTAYAINPDNVISNENINKNNTANTILDVKAHIDSLVDKKLKKFVESGSLVYMTKDYLTDQILGQLKNDWQKDVYRSVYSSVWCTLAESRCKSAAYEFEKHFMEYVTLDNDDCFTVRFGLQKIDGNLPGIEIKFYSATQDIYVRMLDHKASGSGTWSRPLIQLKSGSESKVYFDTFKNANCTYKSFLANVVSKIVLLEGLS